MGPKKQHKTKEHATSSSSSAKSDGDGEGMRTLPSKESSLFRQIVKFYETKQYKKGLKAAEQILKKYPAHGETLSMKGLTLNCLERKDEAYEYVRKGLKHDLKSHVCWHVYGLLYRSDHEYREAIKCYMNALRLDKENIQILRDLSLLQIQMRDLFGFVETRRQLLTLKPGQRNHWIAFAVAHYLVQNYDMAVHVLDAYAKTIDEDQSHQNDGENENEDVMKHTERFEMSEMLLFKVKVLEEGGHLDDAIDIIKKDSKKKKKEILDQSSALESLGRMYLKKKEFALAESLYQELIDRNPENTLYHDGLFEALGLPRIGTCTSNPTLAIDVQNRRKMVEEYRKLKVKYPKCIAFSRRTIDLHEPGDEADSKSFLAAVDEYVRPWLLKGIPSLFKSLQPMYWNKQKVELIGNLFETYEDSLRKHGTLPAPLGQQVASAPTSASSAEDKSKCTPDIMVWVLMYLAQHYDHIRQLDKAISNVDKAIAHTPTVIELYSIKAKIIKHAGDVQSATLLSDHARQLDLADRYLNSKTVKYMLRNGQIDSANQTAVLFTKDGSANSNSKDPLGSLSNLHEMQCMWYEYECGMAYKRMGIEYIGKALQKFRLIVKHFDDIHEDQFDFHSYCLRKMTLRAYVDMLHFEDKLYSHEFYAKGAWEAIECYIGLHDDPPKDRKKQEQEREEAMLAAMSPNERKKHKAKLRKLAKAKEETTAANTKATKQSTLEEDPEKLLFTEDPLGEAKKILDVLQKYQNPPQLKTQVLAFEMTIRRNKMLLALQAVQRAHRISSSDPEAHRILVSLVTQSKKYEEEKQDNKQDNLVIKILKEYIDGMLKGSSLIEYCSKYLKEFGAESVEHCFSAVKSLSSVDATQNLKANLEKYVLHSKWFTDESMAKRSISHQICVNMHNTLTTLAKDENLAALPGKWKDLCAAAYPYSSYFEGAKQVKSGDDSSKILGCEQAIGKLEIV